MIRMARPTTDSLTRPQRYLVRMIIFLALTLGVVALLGETLIDAFMTNPVLNALIVGTAVLGCAYAIRQVWRLNSEVAWLEGFRQNRPGMAATPAPDLLNPIAAMLSQTREDAKLSPMASRSLLDSLGSRLDESREISRYIIGLLIFLGLLGTFWGLIQTISAVAGVIGNLSVGTGDVGRLFDDLKAGLEAPLAGMGTAFSSSLFGLSGSLVLGFLDLQAGQAQSRFFNEVEEWFSRLTKLGGGMGGIEIEGAPGAGAYLAALVEQTAENLSDLKRTLQRSDEARRQGDENLRALTERLATLTDQMRVEQSVLVKLAEQQKDLKPLLTLLVESQHRDDGFDEASRAHLRNVDILLARMVEDIPQGRQQAVEDIRSEVRLLARTIAALAAEDDARR
ncbi:flagellar motor protein MotA [Tistrella bauzanensis]|uniref:Flagellar motor protein MotA n=2 Tax=Tistrella TaxID=171436 RepID=A0ABQ1I921_9PROT|nr:flagellar motor protein MotA [Tistrella bauzanensis]